MNFYSLKVDLRSNCDWATRKGDSKNHPF